MKGISRAKNCINLLKIGISKTKIQNLNFCDVFFLEGTNSKPNYLDRCTYRLSIESKVAFFSACYGSDCVYSTLYLALLIDS